MYIWVSAFPGARSGSDALYSHQVRLGSEPLFQRRKRECAHTHLHFLHLQIIKHVNSSRWRGFRFVFLLSVAGCKDDRHLTPKELAEQKDSPKGGSFPSFCDTCVNLYGLATQLLLLERGLHASHWEGVRMASH